MWTKNFFLIVNIWQSYKQERGCLMHHACLANMLLKDFFRVTFQNIQIKNFSQAGAFLSVN